MTKPDDAFYRRERARLLAALTRIFGTHNLSLAEDVVQETLARAFEVWMYRGLPEHSSALLMTAAKNRALDVLRRASTARKLAPAVANALGDDWTARPAAEELFLPAALQDDELRMLFSVCHPHLTEEVRVALMLNILCGFGAEEIARAPTSSAKRRSRNESPVARRYSPLPRGFSS